MTSRGSDSDHPGALGTTIEPPDRPSSDEAAETPTPTALLPASALPVPAPLPSGRAKRSTLAERLAARMDAISAGQIDDDDDQLDGVPAVDANADADFELSLKYCTFDLVLCHYHFVIDEFFW